MLQSPIRHVVVLVIDSLRADVAIESPAFIHGRAAEFTQARSAGCWTLPSHAAMFTGLHNCRCDRRNRFLSTDYPTLAELFREAGWHTHQATANGVTTDHPAWGLDRGFEEVYKAYEHMPPLGTWDKVLLMLTIPRLRKLVSRGNVIMDESNLTASKVWLHDTRQDLFQQTFKRIREHRNADQCSFHYLNLMECHFPYRTKEDVITVPSILNGSIGMSDGLIDRWREILALFKLINEDWLKTDHMTIPADMLATLQKRQRMAWERIKGSVDHFAQELYERGDTMIVICSDHGDAFGEGGEAYHVQAISDACNRVPLWMLGPNIPATHVNTPVSSKDIFGTILRQAGIMDDQIDLLRNPQDSLAIMQSHYKADADESRRFGQFCFVHGDWRYMYRQETWHDAPVRKLGEPEAPWNVLRDVDPIEELIGLGPRQRAIRDQFHAFLHFAII